LRLLCGGAHYSVPPKLPSSLSELPPSPKSASMTAARRAGKRGVRAACGSQAGRTWPWPLCLRLL
jgi:hypothetical protein